MTGMWRAKLGLRDAQDSDVELINRFLSLLHAGRGDFTRSFRLLAAVPTASNTNAGPLRDEMRDLAAFAAWLPDYRARLQSQGVAARERRAAKRGRESCGERVVQSV